MTQCYLNQACRHSSPQDMGLARKRFSSALQLSSSDELTGAAGPGLLAGTLNLFHTWLLQQNSPGPSYIAGVNIK